MIHKEDEPWIDRYNKKLEKEWLTEGKISNLQSGLDMHSQLRGGINELRKPNGKKTSKLEDKLIEIMREATLNIGDSSYVLEAKAVARFIESKGFSFFD